MILHLLHHQQKCRSILCSLPYNTCWRITSAFKLSLGTIPCTLCMWGKRWLICLLKIVCLLTWKGIKKSFAKRKLKYLLHRWLFLKILLCLKCHFLVYSDFILVKAKYIINQMLLERYWFIPFIFCMIFMWMYDNSSGQLTMYYLENWLKGIDVNISGFFIWYLLVPIAFCIPGQLWPG